MLVHVLGDVGTFYTVLLRVYPSTCVRIFIGIGLYLIDIEHKIGWHSFLETRCSYDTTVIFVPKCVRYFLFYTFWLLWIQRHEVLHVSA